MTSFTIAAFRRFAETGFVLATVASACTHSTSVDVASIDASDVRSADETAAPTHAFCEIPGTAPTGFMIPPGFCARSFATVQHARVLRFAPGGELFVSSPNRETPGYGGTGPEPARIALIADDDHDGRGDEVVTFLPGLDACHGLLFADGAFYYSVGTQILRMPYAPGQRTAVAATVVANLTDNASFVHWPHTLDRSDDGTIFVSRGGDEQGNCPTMSSVRGAIIALDGTIQGRVVARGLRNPMYLRCHRGHRDCYANELTGDFWDALGGTEKLIPIRSGDDWGYPCCIERGHPIPSASPAPDCGGVPAPTQSIALHATPFGLDFEPGLWPAPWTDRLFIVLHGAFNTWLGARITTVPMDPLTGAPDATATPHDFAFGWDDGSHAHGRPSDLTFAPDGRLFVANDITGEIVWIAPIDLRAR